MNEILHHYLEILSDPAHLMAEVTLMLVVDVLFLGLIWPLLRKAIKREHLTIDAEHGVLNHGATKDGVTQVRDQWTAASDLIWEHYQNDPSGWQYTPCAVEHEPGRVCILPFNHPWPTILTRPTATKENR